MRVSLLAESNIQVAMEKLLLYQYWKLILVVGRWIFYRYLYVQYLSRLFQENHVFGAVSGVLSCEMEAYRSCRGQNQKL